MTSDADSKWIVRISTLPILLLFAGIWYNLSLSVYYVLVIRLGWQQKRIQENARWLNLPVAIGIILGKLRVFLFPLILHHTASELCIVGYLQPSSASPFMILMELLATYQLHRCTTQSGFVWGWSPFPSCLSLR